jgi:hypothetical protein
LRDCSTDWGGGELPGFRYSEDPLPKILNSKLEIRNKFKKMEIDEIRAERRP